MNCPSCISGSLNDGRYLCTLEDYRVVDNSNNLVFKAYRQGLCLRHHFRGLLNCLRKNLL